MNKTIKITAVPSTTQRGRWHFAAPSARGKGVSLSLRTWASKRGAILAGKREYNQIP